MHACFPCSEAICHFFPQVDLRNNLISYSDLMEQWMQAFCKNCQILVLCCWPHRQKSSLDVWPWILFFRVNYEPLVIESPKLEKPGHPVLSDLKRNLKRILFLFYSSSFCLLKNVYYLSNEISHVGCTKLELKGKIKHKHPQCDHLALTTYLI